MENRKQLRSRIALVEESRILVRGLDLCEELLGKINLGDMAFLQLTKRLPSLQESIVFNAMAICLAEYGMTPSAIVARMVYSGSPGSIPAAIGAAISAMGEGLAGTMEKSAKLLQEFLPDPSSKVDLESIAIKIVDKYEKKIPGLGAPFHKPVDPRAEKLLEIGKLNGFDGPYVHLMALISIEAQKRHGKSFPISAPGAVGVMACELGLPWYVVRSILAVGRAVGVIGHLFEELEDPLAREIQTRVQEESTKFFHQ